MVGCKGDMLWHDDGNAWMCSKCGRVFKRSRMNPYPDTTHEAKQQTAREIHEHKEDV